VGCRGRVEWGGGGSGKEIGGRWGMSGQLSVRAALPTDKEPR